jgi:prepilin-type N-terminal cleavage/methylation domain-containing protein
MRTSVSSRPAPPSRPRAGARYPARGTAGFTLIEILVVLLLAGMLAGLVLPRLQAIASSVEIANQRKDLHVALEALPYRAYASGQPIVLGAKARDGALAPGDVPFPIPEGWSLAVPDPVNYSATGVCSGGRVIVTGPDGLREAFRMRAPKCELEPIEEGAKG